MPPMSCTSKGRSPSARREASRTVAKAGAMRLSSVAPLASCWRNSSVRALSWSLLSTCSSASSALMALTWGISERTRRSLEEPKILRARAPRLTIQGPFETKIADGVVVRAKAATAPAVEKSARKGLWTQRRRTDKRGLPRCQRRWKPLRPAQIRRIRADLEHIRDTETGVRFMPVSLGRTLAVHAGAALVAALLLAGPTAAQDDKVVATVNGQQITEGELALAEAELDPQFAQLPPDQRRAAALSAMIEIRL